MPPPPADFTPPNVSVGLTIFTSNTESGWELGLHRKEENLTENHTTSMVSEIPTKQSTNEEN